MSYQRSVLGEEEWSIIPGPGTEIIEATAEPGYSIVTQYPSYGTPQENYPYTTSPAQKSSDWWSGIKDILVPVSAAASNIIRAVTGQPVPPGSVYNPRTGQYMPAQSTMQSWLIPALLVGGGFLIVTRMRKK